MKSLFVCALLLLTTFLSFPASVESQKKKIPEVNRAPQLKRTTMRHESRSFGFGGTLTLIGAPQGSVTIEGWSRNEIDLSAEIELQADSEADLNLLAVVNNFVFEEGPVHVSVLTTGTHDKVFMRAVAKKFPKTLLGLPWKIDYRIRVPLETDLEINAGRGPISITGVEGDIRLTAPESEVNLRLSGGNLSATIAAGKVNLNVPVRSWHGLGAEIRVALGEVTVELPPGFNGDINADILRSGHIDDSYGALVPRRTRGMAGPNQITASTGSGGPLFQFTVGDGTIYIKKQTADSKQ
jgi:hypothetical protein